MQPSCRRVESPLGRKGRLHGELERHWRNFFATVALARIRCAFCQPGSSDVQEKSPQALTERGPKSPIQPGMLLDDSHSSGVLTTIDLLMALVDALDSEAQWPRSWRRHDHDQEKGSMSR